MFDIGDVRGALAPNEPKRLVTYGRAWLRIVGDRIYQDHWKREDADVRIFPPRKNAARTYDDHWLVLIGGDIVATYDGPHAKDDAFRDCGLNTDKRPRKYINWK